ncbi:MAG TPA: thioredoxin [Anaerolineales bacterium]|nr:thioredoxin [Anaerolineales bacterium]
MSKVFDAVLASNDMSLDRVLNTGLPVAMVFYERELPADLRQTMDDLARRYAGKALIVMLARSDAPQAASRFGVRQFATLVTVRNGETVTTQGGVRPSDLNPHLAYLLGEGPLPASRAETPSPSAKRESVKGPLSVSETNFDREVLQSDRPVLVDFWAPWCGPCHMVAPTVEALAREQAKALKVVKVNVDENPGLAGRYRTMSIPAMIVFKGGREVDRWVGAMPDKAIRSRVARWIQGQAQTA